MCRGTARTGRGQHPAQRLAADRIEVQVVALLAVQIGVAFEHFDRVPGLEEALSERQPGEAAAGNKNVQGTSLGHL